MEFAELFKKNFPQMSSQEAYSLHKKFSEYDVNPNWLFGDTNLGNDQIAQEIFFQVYMRDFGILIQKHDRSDLENLKIAMVSYSLTFVTMSDQKIRNI